MLRVVKGIDDALDLRDWLYRQPVVAVDTETTGLDIYSADYRVRLTQFGTTTEAWVLPTEGWEGYLNTLIAGYPGKILMHNARFDIESLRAVGVTVPWSQVDDTMIALRLSEPHLSAALKSAAKRHVGRGAGSSQQELHSAMSKHHWSWATVPLDFEPYVFYAAMDTVLTARLAEAPKVQAGFNSPLYQLEMDMSAVCTEMEHNGMAVNLDFCAGTLQRFEQEIADIKMVVKEKYDLTLTSNQSVSHWLDTKGAAISKRTDSGALSVDKESLEEVLAARPNAEIREVVEATLRVRSLTKLSSAYFSNFMEMNIDGVLHPSIETIAAKTGRMSIRNPALQTLPRGDNPDAQMVRRAVVPRADDQVLVGCDYEQIELRLIGANSRDPGLVAAFAEADSADGTDFFTAAMRTVYEDPELPKSDPRRNTIKTLFYASSYGAGVEKMAHTAGVSISEMQATKDAVFTRYPGVKHLQRLLENEASDNDNWVTTPAGRRIWIDPDKPYVALNGFIQAQAADIFKQATVELGHAGLTDYMVVPVHDEMLFSLPEDSLDETLPLIKEVMTTSYEGVQLPADPSAPGHTWGDLEK